MEENDESHILIDLGKVTLMNAKKNPPERTLTNDINIYNYQTQFYDMLWFEEYEHMVQLSTK